MDTLERSLDFLTRTPVVLRALLAGLEDAWLRSDEGPGTFSALDVVGHLIHGEDDDWIPRVERVLEHGERLAFAPFDREGMRRKYGTLGLTELLELFAQRRAASLVHLRALALAPDDLARRGRHPELGLVTLAELLTTWVVHDLAHLGQIARVLAKARAEEVGPWRQYFRVLDGGG
jgi:uncharacterized damage-inducible protein DinB